MAILKCKMCGGTLEQIGGSSVVVCEYCGTRQTVPLLDDEKKIQLFDRANSYRSNCEFDKASLLYEEILSEYPDNAEAHWGVCLCRYGIEYVDERLKGRRVPTCHRTQFKSILEDADFIAAIKSADDSAKEVYRQEAEYIDTVQRGILAISAKEEPFDVFICYKETDSNGDRTKDSVIAQEIYNDLTEMGYKVFFSRITLEDKLGIAYEPYIFAALNSAPLMLIVGTRPEHFNAVWVKNEWSRYLRMIEQGQKKTVVPCYRDMSASEMPVEFSVLQAQDVSKVGWKQDLLRGIGKILPLDKNESAHNTKAEPQPAKTPTGFAISTITSCGATHANDCWPQTPISSVINLNQYSCVSFQTIMQNPFSDNREVSLNYTITDAFGNRILSNSSRIRVAPGNDRLAQVWVLRDSSGHVVRAGDYRITMNVDGGEPANYAFKIINTSVDNLNYTPPVKKTKKSLFIYFLLAIFLGMFGVHSFYAGKTIKGTIALLLIPLLLVTILSDMMVPGILILLWIPIWPLVDIVSAIIKRAVPLPYNFKNKKTAR